VREPAAVGADRVVNAVALKNLYGCPGVVVDFGTATSFDVVDEAGVYLGGAIAPGIAGSLDSLVKAAAKLPKIELSWPGSVIGRDTVSAMQVGTVVGYVAMVDGLLERIAGELGELKHVVATGGLGGLISQHSRIITEYEPHLTLQGIRLIDTFQKRASNE
jgi:type III pantothenate kinase